MKYSQEHLKTMVYAEFGGQTECIMGNWKIENGSMYVSTEHIVSFLPWTQYETLQHMVCNQERMSLLLL